MVKKTEINIKNSETLVKEKDVNAGVSQKSTVTKQNDTPTVD